MRSSGFTSVSTLEIMTIIGNCTLRAICKINILPLRQIIVLAGLLAAVTVLHGCKTGTTYKDTVQTSPSSAARATIRNAKKVVVFFGLGASPGALIDILRRRTDLSVVASKGSTVTNYGNFTDSSISHLSTSEKHSAARRGARAINADLALVIEFEQNGVTRSIETAVGVYTSGLDAKVTLISAQTGNVVWSEAISLVQKQNFFFRRNFGAADKHHKALTAKISDKIMEFRKGVRKSSSVGNRGKVAPENYSKKSSSVSNSNNRKLITAIQTELELLKYYTKGVDGIYGKGTRAAISAYQKDKNLAVDGQPTPSLLKHIRNE